MEVELSLDEMELTTILDCIVPIGKWEFKHFQLFHNVKLKVIGSQVIGKATLGRKVDDIVFKEEIYIKKKEIWKILRSTQKDGE